MYNDSFRMRYGAAPIAIYTTVDCLPTNAHIHNEIELLYIVNGSSKIKISDMCYDANAGDLFVVNPMEVHAITPEASPEYCHQCICFDCSMIVDKQLSAALQDGSKYICRVFRTQEGSADALAVLFQQLFLAVQQNSPALLFETSAIISQIFAELTRRQLIHANLRLVLSVIQRFANRGENADDLFQVGCLGLMKAIDHFDLSHEVKFSTYAVPMILGEVRRYLRDSSSLRVARSTKDIAYKALKVKEELTNRLGREPSIAMIADILDLSEFEVANAIDSMKELAQK